MALIKSFFELTEKYCSEYGDNTIFLIQVGAFFECYGLRDSLIKDSIHGSQIMDFSRICDLNVVDKRATVNGCDVVMAGFKEHLLDKYVKKLQDAGYTVAVYVQDEQCSNTTRSLLGVFSPGTYFSTEIDETNITNNTCCIWLEVKKKPMHQTLACKSALGKSIPNIFGGGANIFVGVSVIDVYTGKTSIMEYSTNYIKNPTTFDELEHFISIHCPSETICISNLPKNDIYDIINYVNIKSKAIHLVDLLTEGESPSKNTLRALNCEKQTYQTHLLSRFYMFNDLTAFMQPFLDKVFATQSFCYLLDFIYQHNPNLVYKISEPTIVSDDKKLILANHTLKQLNIIDSDQYKGKYSSVSRMLNEAITSMGKRKFNYDFLNPVTDVTYLQTEYNIIEHLLTCSTDYVNIKSILLSIKDIDKICRQIILQKVSPRCIYQLYMAIISGKQLFTFIQGNKNEITSYLLQRLEIIDFSLLLTFMTEIINKFETTFILEDCANIDVLSKIEKSFIKENVDTELDAKISNLSESQDQLEACRAYFNTIIAAYETSSKKKVANADLVYEEKEYVKIHETEKNNFSLVATDRRCKILEELLKTDKTVTLKYKSTFYKNEMQFNLEVGKLVIEFQKQTAANKSINSVQINKLCKNVGTIKVSIIDTVISVYSKCIKELEVFQDKLELISKFITFTDVIYSKMYIAEKYDYCKPEITTASLNSASAKPLSTSFEKAFVNVKGLRHCLIEKIQQSEIYVANDLELGLSSSSSNSSDVDGILLYGTNAVGKTSFIRALGISVIMAQAGLYVPASSYQYSPYKCIFTRILGNDNLFKGLSTFAVEMSELRTILRMADENSLVLGDELCSGTESISATSIFVAGIQSLHLKRCSFIFATHLHEIIDYEEITSLKTVVLKHMSVIYDKETDSLIYDRKLKDGPGNNMYGLEVCKSLGLPQEFLNAAHGIRMKYHPISGSLLDAKTSRYNAANIKGMCENCNKFLAKEVHHLQYQQDANDKGIIKKDGQSFHKNNAANLLNLCEKCHDEFHSKNKVCKKVKSTKGLKVKEV
jgi:DNA mismatch repair protein MutS